MLGFANNHRERGEGNEFVLILNCIRSPPSVLLFRYSRFRVLVYHLAVFVNQLRIEYLLVYCM
jgi:hypothetical protein